LESEGDFVLAKHFHVVMTNAVQVLISKCRWQMLFDEVDLLLGRRKKVKARDVNTSKAPDRFDCSSSRWLFSSRFFYDGRGRRNSEISTRTAN
jgi:hypothetical protein